MAFEENENTYDHLEELGGSGYEIVDGEPDITGWDVVNEQGQKIGDVDDLLFDTETQKVRYIIVDLDDNEFDLDTDKKVLVPIGVADLYDGDADDGETDHSIDAENSEDDDFDYDEAVILRNITAAQLAALPAYEKGKLNPETELAIRRVFDGTGTDTGVPYEPQRFYEHDHFNENKFYEKRDTTTLPVIEENLEVGKRAVETGGARITSRIVQRPVQEDINLRQEHVTVERTPVNRPVDATDANTAFTEQEFEITEHAEVPVVNKEARVVEEVSLNKEVEEREETIKETLRNTEVESERIDTQGNKNPYRE